MCRSCYYKWWWKNRRPSTSGTRGVKRTKGVRLRSTEPKVCPQCGVVFEKTPKQTYAYWETRKFCSQACEGASRRGVPKPTRQVELSCQQCGAAFMVQQYRILAGARFCSHLCFTTNRSQGLTSVNEQQRRSAAMRKWRTAVFERDNYTCQGCGVRGGVELNADHIKPFAYFPELRFDVDNGRTLCVPCHRQTDTYGIKAVRLLGSGLGF